MLQLTTKAKVICTDSAAWYGRDVLLKLSSTLSNFCQGGAEGQHAGIPCQDLHQEQGYPRLAHSRILVPAEREKVAARSRHSLGKLNDDGRHRAAGPASF